ncbi:MAG: TIGR03905 family TSCPD domain-containing protein [Bacteroidaceae bacterium]|nr:TIGR03905 family TSCPD domain-containing protein [Bacteroidaceae bacterium]
MSQRTFATCGTCSKFINFEIDDNGCLHNVQFVGGCQGNTTGVARLVEGMKAEEVVCRLRGIQCGHKGTSCPDQLAQALEKELAEGGI